MKRTKSAKVIVLFALVTLTFLISACVEDKELEEDDIFVFYEPLLTEGSALYPDSTLVIETYITAGSGTFTVPTGVTQIFVEVQGGGGGGGGVAANANKGAGGGGGAGYASATLNVVGGRTFTYVVGAGGTGASAGDNDGGTGGQSGFYNATYYINATGGTGGGKGSTNGLKGTNGTGITNVPGGIKYYGGNGSAMSSTRNSGAGGSSASRDGVGLSASTTNPGKGVLPYSGAGRYGVTTDASGSAGLTYGSGGSGGSCDSSCTARAGGVGGVGIVSITYYKPKIDSFPQILNSTYGGVSSNSATHTVTIPQGFSANDTIVIFFSADSAATLTMADTAYTLLYNKTGMVVTQGLFYKLANGSETTAIVTTTVSDRATWRVLTLKNAGTPLRNTTNASSTNADAPLLNTGSSANYLWFAYATWDVSGNAIITGYPLGFSTNFYTTMIDSESSTIAIGANYSAGTDINPAAFTSATEQWVASTIAFPFLDYSIATDSCTLDCSSGTHTYECSDNCLIEAEVDASACDSVTITGAGSFKGLKYIRGSPLIHTDSGCKVYGK